MNDKTISLYNVYDGNKIKAYAWKHPMVIDFDGLKIIDHECDMLSRDGDMPYVNFDKAIKCVASVYNNAIWIQTFREKPEGGFSVGFEAKDIELVETGRRTVNGVEHEAPFYIVTSSVLTTVYEVPNQNVVRPSRELEYKLQEEECRLLQEDKDRLYSEIFSLKEKLKERDGKIVELEYQVKSLEDDIAKCNKSIGDACSTNKSNPCIQ